MYPWASNKNKLSQAINDLTSKRVPYTEEELKAQYIKRGGLVTTVLNDSPVANVVPVPVQVEATSQEVKVASSIAEPVSTTVEEKPKKRTKKTK